MTTELPAGDVRDAWQNQQVEPFRMSPDQIHRGIAQLDKKVRRRNLIGFAICILEIVGFGWFFVVFSSPIQRIGALLTVLGMGYLIFQLYLNQFQKEKSITTAAKMGNAASLEFLRVELERQRNFHRGIWFWSRLVILVPGPLVFGVGFEMVHPEAATSICAVGASILFFAVLAIPLNLRLARKYQKLIDDLAKDCR